MKQEDKDFIISLYKKEEEFYSVIYIKYLEGVEKLTGETGPFKILCQSGKITNT